MHFVVYTVMSKSVCAIIGHRTSPLIEWGRAKILHLVVVVKPCHKILCIGCLYCVYQ